MIRKCNCIFRRLVQWLVNSRLFEYCIILTIIANCVVMSMDTHLPNGDKTMLALQLVTVSISYWIFHLRSDGWSLSVSLIIASHSCQFLVCGDGNLFTDQRFTIYLKPGTKIEWFINLLQLRQVNLRLIVHSYSMNTLYVIFQSIDSRDN